jgi:hypothetical protein
MGILREVTNTIPKSSFSNASGFFLSIFGVYQRLSKKSHLASRVRGTAPSNAFALNIVVR